MPRVSPYLDKHLRSLRQACTDVYQLRGCAPPCPTCAVGDFCVAADECDPSADGKPDERGAAEITE